MPLLSAVWHWRLPSLFREGACVPENQGTKLIHPLSSREPGRSSQAMAASFFNFNNILKGKKSLTKPPQPCKAGLNTTNTGSRWGVLLLLKGAEHPVPAAGQNLAEICHILLYIFDPWWCLSQHKLYCSPLMFLWEYPQTEIPCDEERGKWEWEEAAKIFLFFLFLQVYQE